MSRSALGIVIAAVVVVLVAAVGVVLRPTVTDSGQPVVTSSLTGTVTTVNASGTALCLHTSSSADDLCYALWLPPNVPVPTVSEVVSGWVVRVPIDSGQVEELIVKPASSP